MVLVNISPVLLAGEKYLKTGEKTVPSTVVRGGLSKVSTASSFTLLLVCLGASWFLVSANKRNNDHVTKSYRRLKISLTEIKFVIILAH